MSDSLDKFVLQYTVELKDSIKRLEQLQEKVKKTAKESDKVIDSLKELASDALPGVGKALGGFEKLSGILTKIPPQAYVAVAALLAVAGAVKLVSLNLKEYDAQRITAQKSGMNAVQVEDFQRRMSRGSGGRVNSESARSAIEMIADKLKSAQTNPNMNNRDAIALRMSGISIRGPEGALTSTTEAIEQMMAKMRKSSESVATALGTVNGLTIDQSNALREYAIAQGESSALTSGEVQARLKANASMEAFRKSMGVADEQFRQTRQTLADILTPALEAIGNVIEWVATKFNNGVKGFIEGGTLMYDFFVSFWTNIREMISHPLSGENPIAKAFNETADKQEKRLAAATEAERKLMNEQAEKTRATGIQYDRAANLFSNAVMSFANAVDEREAWAAWAGMAGKASGLRNNQSDNPNQAPAHPIFGETPVAGAGLSHGQTTALGSIGAGISLAPSQAPSQAMSNIPSSPGGTNSQYDAIIAANAKRYGVPFDLVKKVISGESKFKPRAESEAGAIGLMQLMPQIIKAYGIKDVYNPEENIMGGTRLLAENLKLAGGDTELALKYYHGGLNKKNWGRRTNQYPAYILGQNIGQSSAAPTMDAPQQMIIRAPTGRFDAPSRRTLARDDVLRNIEAATGVPFAQIKQGGLSKGDMSKVMGEMYNGQLNHINSIQTKLEGIGLPATEVAKLQRELQDAQRNMETMKRVGSEVVGIGAEGGRNITFGANSVIISVEGSQNPYATATAVKEEFYKKTDNASMVNQQANSIKR